MNVCPCHGEQVLVAYELVLHILGHVVETVERRVQRRGRTRCTARQDFEVRAVHSHLEAVAPPVMLISQTPVRRDTLENVRRSSVQRPSTTGQLIGNSLL